MPNLSVSIPHQLGRSEVKRRLEDQMAQLRRDQGVMLHDLRETWAGDTMSFSATLMGQQLSGQVAVEDHTVQVELVLPWLLNMLAGSFKNQIEERGQLLLRGPRKT